VDDFDLEKVKLNMSAEDRRTLKELGIDPADLVAKPRAWARAMKPAPKTPPVLTDHLLDRFLILPEYKLMFCYIEKVACKSFNTLIQDIRRPYDKSMNKEKPWWLNNPDNYGLKKADLEKILADPSWHKAVFFRDPLWRFLSAYKSKCEEYHQDGEQHCREHFGKFPISFPNALQVLGEWNESRPLDVHFERQTNFCGGVANTIEYYDTVEDLDPETSQEKVAKLLHKIGINPEDVTNFTKTFPKKDASKNFEQGSSAHGTDSGDEIGQYFENLPVGLVRKLLEYYSVDYANFYSTPNVSTIIDAGQKSTRTRI